jgi:hypothetical protein
VGVINEPAVSGLGVTAERDGCGQLDVAVGDIHTGESFPTASTRSSSHDAAPGAIMTRDCARRRGIARSTT